MGGAARSHRQMLLHGVLGFLGQRLFRSAAMLVSSVLIARALGTDGRGHYALALLFPLAFSALLTAGVPRAIVYFVGGGRYATRATFWFCLKVWALVVVSTFPLLWFVLDRWSHAWFPETPTHYLLIGLPIYPALLLHNYVQSFFQARQRFLTFNLLSAVFPALMLSSVAALFWQGTLTVRNAVLCYLAAAAVSLLATVSAWLFVYSGDREPQKPRVKEFLSFSLLAQLSAIVAYLNLKLDIFMCGKLTTASDVGLYAVSAQFAEALSMLGQAVAATLYPRLAELHSGEGAAPDIGRLGARWTCFATLIGAVFAAILIGPALRILFGEAFLGSMVPFLLLAPGIVVHSFSRMLVSDIDAAGHPKLNLYTGAIGFAVNLGANLALLPRLGIPGAAIATTLSYFVTMAVRSAFYCRLMKISARELFLPAPGEVRKVFAVLREVLRNLPSAGRNSA